MNNLNNIVLFCMAVTLSYLIVENACGAGTPDMSSFEIIGEDGDNESVGNISFPAASEESFYLPAALTPLKPTTAIVPRRRTTSLASPSPIAGGSQFFFNLPMEDSIIEEVVEKVPPQIMPRSEVQAVVSSAFRGEPIPEITCRPREAEVTCKPREELPQIANELGSICECDVCQEEDNTMCDFASTQLKLIPAKEKLKQEIVKAVEAKKEQVIAEVVSYELPASSKALSSNMSYVNFDLETRLDSLNNSLTGIASGDSLNDYGIWWQISKSAARQKETVLVDGFKSRGDRVILGYDILTQNDNSYGFAYSLVSNNITFDVGGSSEHIRHHNYSLYSNQTLTNKLYAPLSFSYGYAAIKTKRDMLWNAQKVTGRTKANTYNTKIGLAYNVDVPKYSIRLTPQAYLAHEAIRVNGFVENGTRISKVKSNVLSSILGVSIAKEMDIQHSKLIPELQYSYKRKLKGKAHDIKLTSTANDELIAVNNQKLSKASHTLTSNISIARNKIYSYSLGHQYTKSQDKYTSHTGYLKIRINL